MNQRETKSESPGRPNDQHGGGHGHVDPPRIDPLAMRLRQARKDARLSLRVVAKSAGISLSYLTKLEHGEVKQPSLRVLRGLAAAIDVSPSELLKMAGYPVEGTVAPETLLGPLARVITEQPLTPSEAGELASYLRFIRERTGRTVSAPVTSPADSPGTGTPIPTADDGLEVFAGVVGKVDTQHRLLKALDRVCDKSEHAIVVKVYELGRSNHGTFETVGEQMGINPDEARDVEQWVRRKLRVYLAPANSEAAQRARDAIRQTLDSDEIRIAELYYGLSLDFPLPEDITWIASQLGLYEEEAGRLLEQLERKLRRSSDFGISSEEDDDALRDEGAALGEALTSRGSRG